MVAKEYGKRCQRCYKTGDETFARMYYEEVGGKYLRVCKNCWNALEEEKKKMAAIHRLFGGKKKFEKAVKAVFDDALKNGGYMARKAMLEMMVFKKKRKAKSQNLTN